MHFYLGLPRVSLTFLKTCWLHHKRCSPMMENRTVPFPETAFILKVVAQVIFFSLCSQISASSPWMHQAARCWSDSSPAVSSIWCHAYCNSYISCVVSDAPAQALFPPQPCAGRERGLHMRLTYLFLSCIVQVNCIKYPPSPPVWNVL